MSADLWGTVIVDKNNWPDRVLALVAAEVCHTIKRDAEGNVMRVREIFVVLGLVINHDLFLKEVLVNGAIKYVLDNVVVVTCLGVSVSILQLFYQSLVL